METPFSGYFFGLMDNPIPNKFQTQYGYDSFTKKLLHHLSFLDTFTLIKGFQVKIKNIFDKNL
jgi:hypothetical protein